MNECITVLQASITLNPGAAKVSERRRGDVRLSPEESFSGSKA